MSTVIMLTEAEKNGATYRAIFQQIEILYNKSKGFHRRDGSPFLIKYVQDSKMPIVFEDLALNELISLSWQRMV